jgi:two-component system, chemotaxis family, protein-glutamate methylesterase/glutaminase
MTGIPRLVAIAASTGGRVALNQIIKDLPGNFPVPVVVMLCGGDGDLMPLATWLNNHSELGVIMARSDEMLCPGWVYLAPEHMRLSFKHDFTPSLTPAEPSCDVFFNSIAEVFAMDAIGVVLSGVGRDGVSGMLNLYRAGAMTIAQDRTTSVAHEMSGMAIAMGAVRLVIPINQIASILVRLTNRMAVRA